MTLYLYKIGESAPTLNIENVVSYTDNQVVTEDGTVYEPLADGFELSSLPDCSETLRADWRNSQEPTQLDRVEAQVTYTAMMTDTLLESEA